MMRDMEGRTCIREFREFMTSNNLLSFDIIIYPASHSANLFFRETYSLATLDLMGDSKRKNS